MIDLPASKGLVERRRRKRESRSWAGHRRRDHRDAGKRAKRFGRKREFHQEIPSSFVTARGEEHGESEQLMNRKLGKKGPRAPDRLISKDNGLKLIRNCAN
jgi:hypothetical protein